MTSFVGAKKVVFILTFVLVFARPYLSIAQKRVNHIEEKLGIELSLSGGIGYSYFAYKKDKLSDNFRTPEFRFGIAASKKIVGKLFIKSGFHFGIKLEKNPKYYTYANGTSGIFLVAFTNNFALVDLDRMVSRSNHPFIEIPIIFQYNFNKIGLKTGVNLRAFLQANSTDNFSSGDFLSNKSEAGLLSGFSFKLNKKITIGADYYWGVTNLFKAVYVYGSPPTSSIDVSIHNNFAQLSFEYTLGNK